MKKIRLIFILSLITISLVITLPHARAENEVNEVETSTEPVRINTENVVTNDTVSDDASTGTVEDSTNTTNESTSEEASSTSSEGRKSIDEILKRNREKFQAETKNKINENSNQDEPVLISPNSSQAADVAGQEQSGSKLSAAKKNLIKTRYKLRWQRVTARLNAANNRLEKIIAKIDKKLTKMEADGVSTADFKTRVAELKTDLASLRSEYQSIVTGYQNALSQEDPKAAVKKVHQDIETFIKNIKALHAELMQLVTEMKQSAESNSASEESN